MKSPKKSEMLEVRLSHPDKLALQEKAAREGRTVSDVVRGLISSYLSQDAARSKTSPMKELFMTINSRPKTVLATLACAPLLIVPALMPATASAENLSLSLEGEFIAQVEKNGEEGNRIRRFNTEIHLTPGGFMTMRLPSLLAQGPETGLYMTLQVSETTATDQKAKMPEKLTIDLSLCEVADAPPKTANLVEMIPMDICENANMLAQPKFVTRYGDEFQFKMGDIEGETFTMRATPKKIKT